MDAFRPNLKHLAPVVVLVVVIGLAPPAASSPLWFAVMGDLMSPSDTVELNMEGASLRGARKQMDLRVSLATQRTMASGEKYQSYLSLIDIDCDTSAIVHVHQTRYEQEAWRGPWTFQQFPEVRPMAFGGLLPSPKETILRAACQPR